MPHWGSERGAAPPFYFICVRTFAGVGYASFVHRHKPRNVSFVPSQAHARTRRLAPLTEPWEMHQDDFGPVDLHLVLAPGSGTAAALEELGGRRRQRLAHWPEKKCMLGEIVSPDFDIFESSALGSVLVGAR